MTRKKALCQYLLAGGRLSILNGYRLFGISNISREVRRLVEQPFGVTLTRKKMEGKTKYGSYCTWLEYSLTNNRINAAGIKEMRKALKESPAKKVVKMKAKP